MNTSNDNEVNDDNKEPCLTRMCRLLGRLRRPSTTMALGTLLSVGFVAGVIFWGGFNWSMEATNTEAFCITCHEMEDNVYQEYKETIHYSNRTGVRATCPDCHVPKTWIRKSVV